MTTTKEALEKAQQDIEEKGFKSVSERGETFSLNGYKLTITDFENDLYPYWNEKSDKWYQKEFVRKETSKKPEDLSNGFNIYPYTYAHRSRFYDSGCGYVLGIIDLILSLPSYGVHKRDLNFESKVEFIKFLEGSVKFYHPQIILSVLSWKGRTLMNHYLNNREISF